jgi:uncharacterized protein DUF6582
VVKSGRPHEGGQTGVRADRRSVAPCSAASGCSTDRLSSRRSSNNPPRLSYWMPERIHRRRDADPAKGLDKYGPTLFADPTNKKYPVDTPGRIKAAWAYIHQPSNARKYTAAERRTIMGRIQKAAKARRVTLPDPTEFVELMKRVRRRPTSS